MLRFALGLTLAAFLLLTGCSTEDKPDRTISGTAYANSAVDLKITFPSGWQLKPDLRFGDVKADVGALSAPVNGFSPNVLVLISNQSGPSKMADILPQVHAQLQATIADLSDYQDAILEIDGKEVGQVQYESTAQGIRLHFMSLFYLAHGKGISVNFTDRADHFTDNADLVSIKASIRLAP